MEKPNIKHLHPITSASLHPPLGAPAPLALPPRSGGGQAIGAHPPLLSLASGAAAQFLFSEGPGEWPMAQQDSRGGGLEAAFREQAEFLIRSVKTVKFSIDDFLR